MKQTLKLSWVLIGLLALTIVSSCKKDDDDDDVQEVIAGFTYEVDDENPLMVQFTNTSKNFTSLSWDFGDGQTSTETNPSHTYAAEGEYTVKLTASNSGGSDNVSQTINLVDANQLMTILTGGSSKTWKLLRDVSTGRYPLEVGPDNGSGTIWWAMGYNNNELANRPCMLNDEWTFNSDGSMVFDAKGDYWAEGGVYDTTYDNTCQTTDQMAGVNGEDLSAWGNGTHQFELTGNQLKLIGTGAYLGLSKVATGAEVKVPQDEVTYEVVKLSEGTTDTLIVQTKYTTGDNQPAYWRFVLVHYDNPGDEPGIGPGASFTMEADGLTVTLTNTSSGADTYSWDFGDGTTSTDENPTHTYGAEGVYDIVLTATSSAGEGTARETAILLTDATITAEDLVGEPWKLYMGNRSLFVGPAPGSFEWYSVPYAALTGDLSGGDDWSCIANDEFVFMADGVYEYRTNGDVRNDGYMGQDVGCFSDTEIAALDFPFVSATHTYEVTTEGDNSIITLTNGETGAAFIGFYKAYYGGENNADATAPNGGLTTNRYHVLGYANNGEKEFLFLTVDITADHAGTNSWSFILER